ncbi:MAG: hypothetical protein A2W31_09915 [Planctomycetes bacterium RBG_16_64_10]|nr:MAG: hypothetical protein A2W31_09915 [Planctomycetes bacterium RBG_16_64_10]
MVARSARRLQGPAVAVAAMLVLGTTTTGSGGTASLPHDAHWIWSPAHRHQHVPEGPCYFRKTFTVEDPAQGEILMPVTTGTICTSTGATRAPATPGEPSIGTTLPPTWSQGATS